MTKTALRTKQHLTETRKALLAALPVGVDEALEALEHVGETTTFAAWHALLVRLTVEEAQEGGSSDAPCPLCHAIPSTSNDKQYGFSLPRGLQMHLEGRGRGDPCVVAAVLVDWGKEIETFNTERLAQNEPKQPRQRRRRAVEAAAPVEAAHKVGATL